MKRRTANNDEKHNHGKRNGGGNLRKVANFTGDFPEGGDPCGSGDGDEIRKTKHYNAATNRRNRKRTGEEMKNRIPRTATALIIKMKIASTAGKTGEILTATREADGWHGTNESGQKYFLFLSMLRNADGCEILEIA